MVKSNELSEILKLCKNEYRIMIIIGNNENIENHKTEGNTCIILFLFIFNLLINSN